MEWHEDDTGLPSCRPLALLLIATLLVYAALGIAWAMPW